jgi:signal transduction histidine kinase
MVAVDIFERSWSDAGRGNLHRMKRRKGSTNLSQQSRRQPADAVVSFFLKETPVGTWTLDPHDSRISISEEFKTLHRLEDKPNETTLKEFLSWMPVKTARRLKQAIQKLTDEGKEFEVRYALDTEGGERINILQRGTIIRTRRGKPPILMGMCTNDTPANAQELSLSAQREEYMATLFHDLKNPLLGMNNVLRIMREGRLGDISGDQNIALEQLIESNMQLVSMIQNVVEVYRFERSVDEVTLENTNLLNALSSCITSIVPVAKERQIAISTEFPQGPVTVFANKNALRRLWQNILDNALKFTPADGSIIVRALLHNSHVTVEIEDSGPGITEDEQKVLFKRFKQSSTGKQAMSGSGLGLYLCKKIVTAHGGEISCSSRRGKGTVFSVTLPKATA